MSGRVVLGIIGVLLLIVTLYLLFRGGSSDDEEVQKPKENICYQKEEHSHKDYLVENNLHYLRLNDNHTDIEIVSQNVIFRAHKVILAAHSKYLDSLIFTKIQNQNGNAMSRLELPFIDHKTVEHVLSFIYSVLLPNEVFDSESEYGNLMKASAELQMDWLKCEMSQRLSIRINTKNVGNLVVLSEEADARFLLILSSNYLLDNFHDVSKTKEWQTVANNNRNVLANAIDFHGKLPTNSFCRIQCQPSTIASPSIFMRLRRFYLTQRFTDAEIHIENGDDHQIFHVNRAILVSQSQVFEQQFAASPNVIQINNTSAAVMEEFLIYMYCGWPSQLKKLTEGLLYLSETYEMAPLKSACEDIIIDELTIQNAAKIVEIAVKANSKRLSETVLDFILKNRKEIVTTKAWIQLKEKNPQLLTKIFS